ncbi:hypothetical protein STEG23_031199 [Scotinomys teguina]
MIDELYGLQTWQFKLRTVFNYPISGDVCACTVVVIFANYAVSTTGELPISSMLMKENLHPKLFQEKFIWEGGIQESAAFAMMEEHSANRKGKYSILDLI